MILSLAERRYDRNVKASDLLGAILRFQVVAPARFGVGGDLDVENSRVESGLPMACQARDGEYWSFQTLRTSVEPNAVRPVLSNAHMPKVPASTPNAPRSFNDRLEFSLSHHERSLEPRVARQV